MAKLQIAKFLLKPMTNMQKVSRYPLYATLQIYLEKRLNISSNFFNVPMNLRIFITYVKTGMPDDFYGFSLIYSH